MNGVPRLELEKRGTETDEDAATVRLTSEEMKTAANFTGFDFGDVWDISPYLNDGFPFLRDLTSSGNIPGDVNGDDNVDATDLSMLLFDFGKTGGYNLGSDINGDGKVDATDLSILIANYGK